MYYVFRLDLILGKTGSKKPDVYESKQSLASRVVKVERQVSHFWDIKQMVLYMNRGRQLLKSCHLN